MIRNRRRIVLKWIYRVMAVLIALIIIWLSIPAFPYPFFSHRYQYKYCNVYSDTPLETGFENTMQNLIKRLEANPLNNPEKNSRIFLSHSRNLFEFYARVCLLNPSIQGFNLSLFGNTFISVPRVEEMFALTGGVPEYGIRDGDLSHVMAHELTHQYIKNEIGFLKTYNLLPWKREGYAEYGAHIGFIKEDSAASLDGRINGFLNNLYWNNPLSIEKNVYKAELMIEYLSEIKGYSLEDIVHDSVTYDRTYDDMISWYAERQ